LIRALVFGLAPFYQKPLFMKGKKPMIKQQMEEAVSELREVIARIERGSLHEELEPQEREGQLTVLRRLLRDREAWLRGEVITMTGVAQYDAQRVGEAVKSHLQYVEDSAEMLTKPEAIEWLRERNSFNHEPLRKVEKEWLDQIFIRERMSKGWIGLASVVASAEEQGIHIKDHLQAPCKCIDSVERKRRKWLH
jgi:hypothetical protein